jgi:hypothetical protein
MHLEIHSDVIIEASFFEVESKNVEHESDFFLRAFHDWFVESFYELFL